MHSDFSLKIVSLLLEWIGQKKTQTFCFTWADQYRTRFWNPNSGCGPPPNANWGSVWPKPGKKTAAGIRFRNRCGYFSKIGGLTPKRVRSLHFETDLCWVFCSAHPTRPTQLPLRHPEITGLPFGAKNKNGPERGNSRSKRRSLWLQLSPQACRALSLFGTSLQWRSFQWKPANPSTSDLGEIQRPQLSPKKPRL